MSSKFIIKGGPDRRQRSNDGQALVGGTAMLVLLTAIFMGCLGIVFNTAVIGSYQYKLAAIAREASRHICQEKYWLGMQKSTFRRAVHEDEAFTLTNEMLRRANLGVCNRENFHVEEVTVDVPMKSDTNTHGFGSTGQVNSIPVSVYRVKITVTNLGLGGRLPCPVPVTAEGIWHDDVSPPYAVGLLHFHDNNPDVTKRVHRAIRFPIYYASATDPGTRTPKDNRSPYCHRRQPTGPWPVGYMPIEQDMDGVSPTIGWSASDAWYNQGPGDNTLWYW